MADSNDYRRWLERANQDVKLLEATYRAGVEGTEDSFCYICHQAAEKLLKALLVKRERMAPRTHDLLYLLGNCLKHDASLRHLQEPLTMLNEYAVSARYPDDFGDQRTQGDAVEAFGAVWEVKKAVEKVLRS